MGRAERIGPVRIFGRDVWPYAPTKAVPLVAAEVVVAVATEAKTEAAAETPVAIPAAVVAATEAGIPAVVKAVAAAVPPALTPTTITATEAAALPAEPLDALAAVIGLTAVEAVAPDVPAQLKLFALQAPEAIVGARGASAGEEHSHAQ